MGGDNGKTTFLEICREALQSYAGEVQIETLMAKPKEAMMGNWLTCAAHGLLLPARLSKGNGSTSREWNT
jgi:hypothetical protein